MITRNQDYKNIPYFTAIIVLYLDPVIVRSFNPLPNWYVEDKIIYSDKISAKVFERGNELLYRVQFAGPYHNVKNTAKALELFEAFALSKVGARQINYYDPRKKKFHNFVYKQKIR